MTKTIHFEHVDSLSWIKAGRIPSLDGLRGVSILLVVWSHIVFHYHRLPNWALWFSDTGPMGVDTFFVISGFLITLLMIREQERRNRVSLIGFWVRRAFRILPAYLLYVILIGTALHFTSSALSKGDWVHVLTYSVALLGARSFYIFHSWSLSVEEHFYLVWPILFVTLSRRRLFISCVGYCIIAVLLRIALYKCALVDTRYFTFTRGDSIAAGCALALIVSSRHRSKLVVRGAKTTLPPLVCLLVLGTAYAFHNSITRWPIFYRSFMSPFISEWCIVVIVWYVTFHPDTLIGRILNWRPLTAIGILSYSIYLWQQPFLGAIQPFWAFKLPWNLLVIAIFASASYFFVELPFLRIKSRFEPTRESKSRSLTENLELFAQPS